MASASSAWSASFLRCLASCALGLAIVFGVVAAQAPAHAAQFAGLTPATAKPDASTVNGAAQSAPSEQVAPDSPRAAIADFNKLTRAGDYAKAARYLDLSDVDQSDGPVLAKHLRDVLDRHLWIDIDKLSPSSHGNDDDGLAPDREELGNVPGATGKPEPVVIVRHVDRLGARWVFAASTVSHVEAWYTHLETRWLLENLPKWALGFGPHELGYPVTSIIPGLGIGGIALALAAQKTSKICSARSRSPSISRSAKAT